jgi:hypothetical protein
MKETRKGPQLDGSWNVPSLVVYGRTRRSIHLITFSFPTKMISSFSFTIDFRAFTLT